MDESNQIRVPDSFLALFRRPGAARLTQPPEHILARYELCEDLAQMLAPQAADRQFELGVTPADVLARIEAGLVAPDAPLAGPEAVWVVRRLAELLNWDAPGSASEFDVQ